MHQRDIGDVMGLTPMQEGILFHYLVNRESDLYYEQICITVSGKLEEHAFEKAWQQVVQGNEMLRACFRWENIKSPVQVILKQAKPDTRFYDLQEEDNEVAAVAAVKSRLLQHRWDIREEVPFLVALCQLRADRYELILMHHHILFDGWSTGILLKEFFTYYNQPGPAAARRIQASKSSFKDYIRLVRAADNEALPGFWKQYLAAIPDQYIGRRAASMIAMENEIALHSFASGVQQVQQIREFTGKHQITLAAYIYGCWAILLRHYTDHADTLFGTTVSGRPVSIRNIENTIGLFINTLPLRVRTAPGQRIADFFKSIGTDLLNRSSYELTSLSQLKQASGSDMRGDLFESVVVLENYPLETGMTGDGPISLEGFTYRQNSNYQLTLTIHPQPDEISFGLYYKRSIYPASLVKSMLDSLANIIAFTLAHPDAVLQQVELLSAQQQSGFLHSVEAQDPAGTEENIFDCIAGHCMRRRSSEKAALITADDSLSYGDLLDRANRLAQVLAGRGVKKGALVAIFLERSPDLMIAILATWKAGAAYLPVDPELPAERIRYILDESSAQYLVVSTQTAGRLSSHATEIMVTAQPEGDVFSSMPVVKSTDPAYVIYTSGSTGRPKGVVIEHGNIRNFISGIRDRIAFHTETRFLSLTTVSFDIFVLETILPLATGNTVYLGSRAEQQDPKAVARAIVTHGLSLAQFTPSQLDAFLEEKDFEKSLGCLQFLLVGGEAFPQALLKKIQACYSGRIYNMYGPTETTVWSAISELTGRDQVTIGSPVRNTSLLVLNSEMKLVPHGVQGNLYIGGEGMARGYLNNPLLTHEKFVAHPYRPGQQLYHTGDCAMWEEGGELVFRGRKDTQVKLNGFRIELGEIEHQLLQHPQIAGAAVVVMQEEDCSTASLCGFYTGTPLPKEQLKAHLRKSLPAYMVPATYVHLDELPLTPNKKTDRNSLAKRKPASAAETKTLAPGLLQSDLAMIWRDVLQREQVGPDDNFFDTGGTSLLSIRLAGRINKKFGLDLTVVDVFEYPSLRRMAERIGSLQHPLPAQEEVMQEPVAEERDDSFIAVIGMAGRFPQAADLDTFWKNLDGAVESVTLDTGRIERDGAGFVHAKGNLDDPECFDALFFGYTPAEAAIMDPQIRIFHEIVWEALEQAGYNPYDYRGAIGLYAGATPNTGFESDRIIHADTGFAEKWNAVQYADKDFLSTRISYKLDLKGPSYTIHAACSTSLVAIDLACSELRSGKCDMALAGGVSVTFYDKTGYQYTEGMIFSPDGHCRAFDKDSNGTVGGNGAGVVVLKKLSHAIRDRDHILAVIRGSAVNNDGNRKTGYTAPGVPGQESVIKKALANAGVPASSVSYIETHGTGTPLGDVIEIEALKRSYSRDKKNDCAIGSVKTNIGHLDVAAGVAGFIKTVLALQHRRIPASLHFRQSNPVLKLEGSSFYVNDRSRDWNVAGIRRAGVTSLGLGGTNVHVVLEEAPAVQERSRPVNPFEIIGFSAASAASLERYTNKLNAYLREHPATDLSDLAYTLQTGRKQFKYRRSLTGTTVAEALAALTEGRYTTQVQEADEAPVVFMFSGQGTQYVNMGYDLYTEVPVFRDLITALFKELEAYTGEDFLPVIYPAGKPDEANERLQDPYYTQPVKFIFEYALSKLLMSWGIRPAAMIGHSFGEYTAACIAGVFSFSDALKLIVKRGQVMNKTAEGRMLSVGLSEAELQALLPPGIDLAAVNAPELCIVSGTPGAIASFEQVLAGKEIETLELRIKVGGHSSLMDPVLNEFEELAREITYHPPAIPFISGTTGAWITDTQACDPGYWTQHLRQPIRFCEGITELLKMDNAVLLQLGSGKELCLFAEKNPGMRSSHIAMNLLRRAKDTQSDLQYLAERLGMLWAKGCRIDWDAYRSHEKRYKVPVPTYSFEKKLYPVCTVAAKTIKTAGHLPEDWVYLPSWKTTALLPALTTTRFKMVLVFEGSTLQAADLLHHLPGIQEVIKVTAGDEFAQTGDHQYSIDPADINHYQLLAAELSSKGLVPDLIFHLWNADSASPELLTANIEQALHRGYFSLAALGTALDAILPDQATIKLIVVSACMQYVAGDDTTEPFKAPVMAALNGLSIEYPALRCSSIDTGDLSAMPAARRRWVAQQIVNETATEGPLGWTAYRGYERLEKEYRPAAPDAGAQARFPRQGVILITGGLSGAGFEAAISLTGKERSLVLTGRTDLAAITGSDKRERLEVLRAGGNKVIYLQGDIADAADTARIIAEAESALGTITGVIHAAGLPGGKLLSALDRQHTLDVLAPKIKGTIALYNALAGHRLDFFLLFSSLANMLPAVGQTDYSAANFFLDSFAAYARLSGHAHTVAINWDRWKGTGMAMQAEQKHREMTGEEAIGGIAAGDATLLLQKLAMAGTHQQIVSSADLSWRIGQLRPADLKKIDPLPLLKTGTAPDRSALSAAYKAPATTVEQQLAATWKSVLGFDEIGVEDDFFELGGDSIRATILLGKIRKQFGLKILLKDFIQRPGIRHIATLVNGTDNHSFQPIGAAPLAAHYPLSPSQQRLLFLQDFDPSMTAYNETKTLRLQGVVNKEKLAATLSQVVARHESLRTTFHVADGTMYQVVHEPVAIPLAEKELEGEEQDFIQQLIRPFDLSAEFPLRVTLVRCAPEDHLLVIDIHHIAADGFSVSILISDFLGLYTNAILPQLTIHPKDHAVWSKAQEDSEEMQAHQRFWKARFDTGVQGLELPFDYLRPEQDHYTGTAETIVLHTTVPEGLSALARQYNTNEFTILLSAWFVFLYKITGQPGIVIGTPASGRNHAGLEHCIGMFVNMLPLRQDIRSEMSFPEFLSQVREQVVTSLEHQDYQFENIVRDLGLSGDTGRMPLIDAAFVYNDMVLPAISLGEANITSFGTRPRYSKFDLALYYNKTDNGIPDLQLHYKTSLFRPATVQQLCTCFSTLLAALTAQPVTAIRNLPLLTKAESHHIISSFNPGASVLASDKSAHRQFEEQVRCTPDRPAIVYRSQTITYAALNEQADQLAALLRTKGVGPGTVVAVLVERTPELAVYKLAILKAGGVYMPISVKYPAARIQYILRDSQAHWVLCPAWLRHLFPYLQDRMLDTAAAQDPHPLAEPVPFAPGQPAYIIYTSGSTGQPKGVVVGHDQLNAMLTVKNVFGSMDNRRVMQTGAVVFDVTVFELWVPLLNGATLYLQEEEDILNEVALKKFITENKINFTFFTPALFNQLLDQDASLFNTIDTLILGGDVLSPIHIRKVWENNPQLAIYNGYGPTEVTVFTTMHRITDAGGKRVPIGKGFNSRLYVVNADGQIMPPGLPGELWIAGKQVAKGYLNNPDFTASRFINDPFGTDTAYKTGDIVKWMDDGNVEFLGRRDTQVKIRGFRVDTTEIEMKIAAMPGIREVVVAPVKDEFSQHRLVAWFTAEQPVPAEEMRVFLQDQLPVYMIPAHFSQLQSMPVTVNGKLDKAALPKPVWDNTTGFIAPVSEEEKCLAETWQQVLKTGAVSVHDNFFDLGGDSIKAIRIISRLRAMGYRTEVRDLFHYPEIGQLALRLQREAQPDQQTPLATEAGFDRFISLRDRRKISETISQLFDGKASIERAAFLSPVQEGMLFHHLQGGSGSLYAVQAVFTIEGPLQQDLFAESLSMLVRRHESLRTRIVHEGIDRPVQIVVSGLDFRPAFSDITLLDEAAQAAATARCSSRQLSQGFDLLQDHLMRVQLFRLNAQQFRVIWTFHHMVQDGWCMHILLNELFVLYRSLLAGQSVPLPPAKQYAAYLDWRSTLDKSVLENFWRRYLAGLEHTTSIPARHAGYKGYKGGTQGKSLSQELVKKLYQTSKKYGVTMNSLVQSAWSILLSRYNNATEVVFGAVMSGRPAQVEGIEEIVGLFINTIPVRIRLEEAETVESLLHKVQENNLDCVPYQYHSLAGIQELSTLKGNLINHILVFENYPSVSLEMTAGGDTFRLSGMEAYGETSYDFTLIIQPVGEEELRCLALYNVFAYGDSFIARLLDHFSIILEQLTGAPAALISDLDMLSAGEQTDLVERNNDVYRKAVIPGTVCSLLADQARDHAQAIALDFPGGQLTYALLDQYTNTLAHYLRSCGLAKGGRAAVKMKRSANMVIALYAVMKTGAAYVPIDVDFPQERVAFILQDSGAALLLNDGAEETFDGVITVAVSPHLFEEATGTALNEAAEDDAAYIMYTSGSTGKPKGVVLGHRAVMHTVSALAYRYPLSSSDSYLFKTPSVFDVCVHELFGVLPRAARLVIAPQGQEKDPYELLKTVSDYQVTHLCLVPSLFNAMVHVLTPERATQLQQVKYIFVAGEAMDAGKAKELTQLIPSIRLVNAYGPTEASIYATAYDLTGQEKRSVPIGSPLNNVRIYLLGPGRKLQPMGVDGEIFIAGGGVAREYLNNPALTARCFFDDPFFPGERMYKTGDTGRWLQPGLLDFCGRVDKQVKIRGLRIEPGEIEAVLKEYPGIGNAAVCVYSRDNDKYLAAWYEAAAEITAEELKTFLQRRLPVYMVPSVFTRMTALPLTASGKIDQGALPQPAGRILPAAAEEWATTPAAQQLLEIWSGILQADAATLGPGDHFFDKGGHSIKAIYLLAAVNNAFDVSFRLPDIYRYPVFSEMLEQLEGKAAQKKGGLKKAEKKQYYPLSPAQERLFYIQSLDPQSTAYNMPYVIELDGTTSRAALNTFLASIAERYDSFRISFVLHQGKPVQCLHKKAEIEIEVYEEPVDNLSEVLKKFVRPFDLGQLPLVRAAIVTAGASKKLLVDVHHIIFDGTSQNIIRGEFSKMLRKEPWANKPLFSYLDYTEWQQKPVYKKRIEKQELFWHRMFSDGHVALNLSTDGNRAAEAAKSAATIRFRLDEEESREVLELSRQTDVSPFVFVFTVFNVFLSRLTSQDDIVVGVPVAGRSDDGLATAVGMFVNYLPVRTRFNADISFNQLLRDMQQHILLCFENQDYQYEELFEKLQIRPQKNRNPLFDVVCNYVDAEDEEDIFGMAENWDTKEVLPLGAKTDLILRAIRVKGTILFEFEYAAHLFREQTVRNYAAYYTTLIRELVRQPDIPVASVKMNKPGRSSAKTLLSTNLR